MNIPAIPIVLLAAGSSSRMGQTIKQLLPWGNGTLIEHMMGVATASLASDVVVVLGANYGRIREVISPADKCHITENPCWEEGISASIAHGVQYLREYLPAADGILIMLCDQPLLKTAYLDQMITTFVKGGKDIVASDYGNTAGVPAIFGSRYFPDLCHKGKHGGAQGLLKQYISDVRVLEAGAQVLDMDVAGDYERLLQLAKNPDSAGNSV